MKEKHPAFSYKEIERDVALPANFFDEQAQPTREDWERMFAAVTRMAGRPTTPTILCFGPVMRDLFAKYLTKETGASRSQPSTPGEAESPSR